MSPLGKLNIPYLSCNIDVIRKVVPRHYATSHRKPVETSFVFFILPADNRGALRDLEGLEKLVEFVGNKVSGENAFVKLRKWKNICMCLMCDFLQEYEDLHVQALQVLSNCLQDVESMQVVYLSFLTSCLMDFLVM